LSIVTIKDSIASIKSKLQQIINIGSVFDSTTSFGGRKTKVYFHSNSDIGSKVWNSNGMVETLLNSNMTKLLLQSFARVILCVRFHPGLLRYCGGGFPLTTKSTLV
jgi:hypothetical protein